MSEKVVLAVDPGHRKCGLALVKRDTAGSLELLWHKIVPTDQLVEGMREAKSEHDYELIILGGGTTSNEALLRIRADFAGAGILVVDETDTTLQARERYWEYHPRRGWRQLLPATLQVPPEPVDDFAALILAERVLVEQ